MDTQTPDLLDHQVALLNALADGKSLARALAATPQKPIDQVPAPTNPDDTEAQE